MSGGLDSTLAAKIVKDQGVEVIGLHLLSPFGCRTHMEASARSIGVRVIYKEKGESYLDLIKNPRYGYGKNMNPCIDCRISMFLLADVVRQDEGAHFILTGEVLGQRPMSQRRDAICIIDRDSHLDGLILRPLSAHRFAATLPEEKGWVDRSLLLNIAGRGRKAQFALANQYGIKDFATPGGGCLLTEAGFSNRLKDFLTHEDPKYRMAQADLLRFGRHFRLSEATKVVLGRNQSENEEIEKRWREVNGVFFSPLNFNGPSAIALGQVGDEEKNVVGEMIFRYSRTYAFHEKQISYITLEGTETFAVSQPISEDRLNAYRL